MSADARWVRLNVVWDGSVWLAALPWPVRAAWPLILCYVKREGREGRVKAPIAQRFAGGHDIPVEVITALSNAAIENGALIVEDGHWIIANWDVYQKPDPTNAERQKRYKQAHAGSNANNNAQETPDNAPVTPLPCHATETETVTITSPNGEGAPEGATSGKKPARSEFFIGLFPPEYHTAELKAAVSSNFKMRREKKKAALTETTLRARAAEWTGNFTPSEIETAFREATLGGWDGVFPKKAAVRGSPTQRMTKDQAMVANSEICQALGITSI
jgi:hypothetical protein